ncbi:hybrid sensor histidine kinase/response regulator [Methylomonas sp. OY6]|uniref:histidine kinase n=1 Tax=Methylomonas defluvii TaxID=3045149 RepID=A0ABU4U8C6_9GAMM|nr:hybrid sensor histidine kinase/response regulator [Methylomonas sp. OY6]MDX8125671.1 hybrid sensor histidine kinase/response regulator [Methylomonas sp. OY6]
MEKLFSNPRQDGAVCFSDISPNGQLRLLDLSFGRIAFGFGLIPVVAAPFIVWLHQIDRDARAFWAWAGVFTFVALAVRLLFRRYRRDCAQLGAERAMHDWLSKVHALALLYGFSLSVPVLIMCSGDYPFEFAMLFLVTCASIVAGNATHQSPILSAFQRFFAASWGVSTLLIPWVFPAHWPYVMPLSALYILSIYKHAVLVHRFFLQQIFLEEGYRAAKDLAEAALRAKNQFLTTASHDLRQPVHAMGFLIESISRRNRDLLLGPALQDLRQSVQSVTQMFNSLLDLSRIELGAQPVNLQTVALDPLMNDVATLFREEARVRQIELRVRTSAGKALVRADPLLLRQSMINLMQNALRYTQSGGVLMAARRRRDGWQFEVWDTGVGIAEDDQQRIYSPFFRPEHAWRIDNAGHGLGLAVVARCADLMGASQGLSSREGQGSRFWLRLLSAPLEERRAVVRDRDFAPAGRGEMLSGRCLVIDDEPQVRNAWQALLNSWGVETACAASANDALALLDAGFEPQAIFCDQRLRAGESGFELLQALLERCPDAAGAMISGEFNSPALAQAEQEGYLVLHKPLDPEALYALLSRLLPADPLTGIAKKNAIA